MSDEQAIPNKLVYKRQSVKVWKDFASVMSDHYLVTCELSVLEQKHRVEERRESKIQRDVKRKLNIPNGSGVGKIPTAGGRNARMGRKGKREGARRSEGTRTKAR